MQLKEFDVWAYKLDRMDARKFNLANRCICAHFERHFRPIKTDNVFRVFINLGDEKDHRIDTIKMNSTVLEYYKSFNFKLFNSLEEVEKKKHILDTVFSALIELSDICNWPKDNFKDAYDNVIRENYSNQYIIQKKNNSNRKIVAELIANHNTQSFDCYLRLTDKETSEVIFKKLLFTEKPDEFLFSARIGNIKWVSKNTITYSTPTMSEYFGYQFYKESLNNEIKINELDFNDEKVWSDFFKN